MNKVILMGRLTRDPNISTANGETMTTVARFTLAVDRRFSKKEGEQSADFIGCVAFGRTAEFAERYLRQGIKVAVTGRIQTGSYTNREGQKVYTTDVVLEDIEFAESKEPWKHGYGRRLSAVRTSSSTNAKSYGSSWRWFYEHPRWNR